MKLLATALICSSLLLGCTTRADLDAPPAMTPVAPSPTASGYESLRFEHGAQRWWTTATVYEIWPRSFKDSDGDGNGDFNGMTSKLDYLQSLGVNAVWLTPVFEAPSYHGYDFQDFYSVERDYGTMAEFERFIAESHKREGLLYVGSDDGLIQVSEDGGANWRKVDSIAGVPSALFGSNPSMRTTSPGPTPTVSTSAVS